MTGYKSKKAAAQAKVEGPIHVVCQCDKCKAQPAQELEAWANSVWEARATHGIGENTVPLYITPPQRPWVGLTDEDWKEIEDMPDTFDQGVAWCLNTLQRKNT